MDDSILTPASQLLYILNHQLVTDELAASPQNARFVLDTVDNARLILEADREAQRDEKAQSAVHRWNLRITSLTASKIAAAQAVGFQLALQTAQQSEHLYLQNVRAWFNAAFLIVSRKSPASLDSFLGASDFLLYSFEKARFLPEFAREVANAGAVRKFGEGLLNYAGTEACDVETRVAALDILSDLIVISASPLRPLSQHIQNLAVGLLCAWSQDESLLLASRSAVRLLGNVYIVAGKAQAGQSWRRTVESICGSIHLLLNTLASTTMEEQGLSANLPPLEMPPIASTSSSSGPNGQAETLQVALKRLEALVNVLILMLASPTERAVPVPVAALVKLCQRVLNLTIYSPLKERHDTALRTAQVALLPSLHSQACRLLAQLVTALGVHLTSEATQLLTLLSFVEGSYPAGSPARVTFFAVASLIVEHVAIHPDESVRPLTKIVQSILRDAASLVDPDEGRKTIMTNDSSKSNQKSDSRKAKRARLFESDQVMSGRRRTTLAEAELINHSLSSLHRIILHGAWLFPGPLLSHTLRLLLAYGLSGQFFNALPDFSPNSLLSEGLALCPAIRVNVLRCLLATLQTIGKEAHGLLELALTVFKNGLNAPMLSEEGRRICSQALGMLDNLLRPVVPPLVKSMALRQATRDLTGGSVLGKQADYMDPVGDDRSHMDLGEAEALQSSHDQAALASEASEISGANGKAQQSLQTQPMAFPSSAAPSAQDVTFSTFGLESASSNALSSVKAPSEEPDHPSSKSDDGTEQGTSKVDATIHDYVEDSADEEPTLIAGGGRQAELAAVNWNAEDPDTSDDDAPMPKIYMSDDEEE